MKDPKEKSEEFPKLLIARVVAVSNFQNSPIEIALADNTGAIKLLWYTNASSDIEKIKENVVPDGGCALKLFNNDYRRIRREHRGQKVC